MNKQIMFAITATLIISGCVTGNTISQNSETEFAKCLTENNAVLYGAYW
ncbi:MAG: hypothetical protein KAI53_00500 [Candidatus Aenigmarchaeota archaeon]|nr:hypothetical protein [Candidatus Aenigmarchaeota archaeon]